MTNLKLLNPEAEEEDRLLSRDAIGSLLKIFHEHVDHVVEESKEAIRVFDKFVDCLEHLRRVDEDGGFSSWRTKIGEKMKFRRELGEALKDLDDVGGGGSGGGGGGGRGGRGGGGGGAGGAGGRCWKLYKIAEETKSKLRLDENLLKKLKAVAALDSPPRDSAEYLTENISTNALTSALSASRGDAAKTASMNLCLAEARRRNRKAAEDLLLRSTSAVDELSHALAAAKKVGLHFPVENNVEAAEGNRRDVFAKERMLVLGGKKDEAAAAAALEAVAVVKTETPQWQPPEAAMRLCSLASFRQIPSCSRNPKLMFEIESRDELAKRRLLFASRLDDAKMMKEATDDFKLVGLTNADGPLEEVERRLVEVAWNLKTEKKGAAAADVDGRIDEDVFETSWNRLTTFSRPDESVRATREGNYEKFDENMSLINEAIKLDDWNALSEGVEEMKREEEDRGSARRRATTAMSASTAGDSAPLTSIASKAELLLLTALLVEGRDAPFRSATLAASTPSLKALEEELRDKDAKSLRIAMAEMKRKVLNELEGRYVTHTHPFVWKCRLDGSG